MQAGRGEPHRRRTVRPSLGGGCGSRLIVLLGMLLASTGAAGCAPEPQAGPGSLPGAATPAGGEGADVQPEVVLGVGDGEIVAEVAFTAEQRALGLMHRPRLDADRGMLFVFPAPQQTGFWMKNTLIELTIAFMVAEPEGFRIVDVLDMTPCRSDPCPTYAPQARYDAALEVNRGRFVEAGVGVGDLVTVVEGDLPLAR